MHDDQEKIKQQMLETAKRVNVLLDTLPELMESLKITCELPKEIETLFPEDADLNIDENNDQVKKLINEIISPDEIIQYKKFIDNELKKPLDFKMTESDIFYIGIMQNLIKALMLLYGNVITKTELIKLLILQKTLK